MQKFSPQIWCKANNNDSFCGKTPTPMLDVVESPIHLKNLSMQVDLYVSFCAYVSQVQSQDSLLTCNSFFQELKQLADEIRSDLLSTFKEVQKPSKASLAAVELTVAIHHVFHAPADKILWDVGEQVWT